jgi:hypothetical protein
LGFVSIVSSEWQGAEVTTAIILNTLILIYIMLPGTRRAFGRA